MKRPARVSLALAILASFIATRASAVLPSQIVYDAIPNAGSGGRFSGLLEIGQKVTLAGQARQISLLEVRISLFGDGLSTPSLLEFSLYDATAPLNLPSPPGPLLWRGLGDSLQLSGSFAIVGAHVPNVHVPNDIAWTIRQVAEPADFILTGNLPSIGTAHESLFNPPGGWTTLDADIYTARITAVPEPSIAVLAGAALIAAIARRRTKAI
jgi:hypothetical protein